MTLYRLAQWPLALRELQEHHEMSGSYDQFPVIADCYRAMHRYVEAEATWCELRQASPSPKWWRRAGWWPPGAWPTRATCGER